LGGRGRVDVQRRFSRAGDSAEHWQHRPALSGNAIDSASGKAARFQHIGHAFKKSRSRLLAASKCGGAREPEAFFAETKGIYYYCSTKAKKYYHQVVFEDGCYLLFGKETKGLPEELIFHNPANAIKIPMRENLRSLNLSNSVSIVLYEALRQSGFSGLQ
jgi:tRNA(Leu) C34 or U34 (ribose-2'-O)-methylase TrmL